MKNLAMITLLTLGTCISQSAFAADSWVVLTKKQNAIIKSDICAKAAVDAAAALVYEEIMEIGVDFPEHLYLLDLQVIERSQSYNITFEDEATIIVNTKKSGSKCKSESAERIHPEIL